MTLPRPHLSPARYFGLILVLAVGAALAGYAFFLAPSTFETDVPPEVRARPILPNAPEKPHSRITVPLRPGAGGRSASGKNGPLAASSEGAPYTLTRVPGPAPSQQAWVLDVLTTARRAEADRIFDRLLHAPYQVYAYTVTQGGQKRYRVRVGFFGSRRQAEQAGRILVRQYKLPQPRAAQADNQERARFASPGRDPGSRPRLKP
jgi:hypothetical protein